VGPYSPSGVFWNSDNINVVHVWDGELFTEGVGTATVSAAWETCLWWYDGYGCGPACEQTIQYGSVAVTPVVQIADFQVVQKGSSRNIFVGVSPTNNTRQITLKITKTSGTGSATFDNDTASKIITQSGTVEIKGVTESSAKDNFILEATIPTFNGTNTIASKTFSVAKVKISGTIGDGSESEITATKDTIVGERIKLKAEVLPSGITVSGHSWAIDGNIVKSYSPTPQSYQIGSTVPVQMNIADPEFVWVDGGTGRQATYTGTVNGVAIIGQAIFNIARPDTQINASSTAQTATNTEVQLGSATVDGITFNRGGTTVPSPFSGDFQWVQVIDSLYLNAYDPNGNNPGPLTRSSVLDEAYPYSTSTNTGDSPGLQLACCSISIDYDTTFSMYLMFKPSGGGSQWVPLRKVTWRWAWTSVQSSGVWQTTASHEPRNQNLTDSNVTVHPTWGSVFP
jgi:hypothetical protein